MFKSSPAAGRQERVVRPEPRARPRPHGGRPPKKPMKKPPPAARRAARRQGSGVLLRRAPRPVREDVRRRPGFREGLARLAGPDPSPAATGLKRQAELYLKEIAAAHSPIVENAAACVTRLLYRRGFDDILYDPARMEELKGLAADHPLVFLPSHKSNLDHLVLRRVLWESGHRNHQTAGGVNMSFFPIGPIARRAGLFFIRRTFGDDPLYKFVLRSYFEYLIERGATLEWYMEGTRSRTGKLLCPRYGLLGYAADALEASDRPDIYLVPTSISYDHVHELDAYTAEQAGVDKQPETLTWLVGTIRALRRPNGNIHLRFGEPLSLREAMAAAPAEEERYPALQRAAVEVCARINRITPVTPSALATAPLLAAGGRPLTRTQLAAALSGLAAYVRERGLPTSEPLDVLEDHEGLDRIMHGLAEHGAVAVEPPSETGGEEETPPAYRVPPDRRLAAGYYRNTIIHFFVAPAAAEAGLAAAAAAADSSPAARPSAAFWNQAAGLRDLLGSEFFFPGRRAFLDEIRREMDRRAPAWEDLLEEGSAHLLLERIRPHFAPWVLRPYLEAYLVAAEELAARPADRTEPEQQQEQDFLEACLERGARYLAEGRITAAEAVSRHLFAGARRQAGLWCEGDAARGRPRFAEEITRTLSLFDLLPGGPFPPPAGPDAPAAP